MIVTKNKKHTMQANIRMPLSYFVSKRLLINWRDIINEDCKSNTVENPVTASTLVKKQKINNVHIAALLLKNIYKRNVHFDYKWNKCPGLHTYF